MVTPALQGRRMRQNLIMREEEETGPRGLRDRHNLQERIVQIRPALSVQAHLWPWRFNCIKTFFSSLLCSCLCICAMIREVHELYCTCSAASAPPPSFSAKRYSVSDAWCKSEACVLHDPAAQLKLILQSESRVHVSPQLCKLRSCGVTERLARPCSCLQRSVTM